MRRESYILGLALVGVLALPSSPVSAQPYSQHRSAAQVDVGVFYDGLAPYGEWVEMRDYGWSWAPRVERGWRPYTRGQWVMTDDGWYWDSDEQFGWAAYHYGRWVNDPYYGWIWVPGTEWAPAWVSWRHGNGYTGWAPLPPRATWRTRVGLSIGGLDIDAFIGADDYAFVQDRAFVDRGIYERVLPPTQNVTIINVTNNVTNYTVANDRVFNGGIAVANVERAVGRSVPRARTVDVTRADALRSASAGEVAVFRPEVRVAPERRPAQGRSLVRGEQPPPLLVERRQVREQEQQQRGHAPEVTAKDVAQRRPAAQPRDTAPTAAGQPQTPRPEVTTPQEAPRQRDQAQQDAARQRAKDQGQRELDAQAQADARAKGAQQERAQKQTEERQNNQQQLDRQRAKQATDEQAQADARAKGAQQERAQKQTEERQNNQQQMERQRAKQESDAQAQGAKRAKDAPPQARDNPPAKPKDNAKDNPKDKGKKNPKDKDAPPPQGQQQ